MTPCRIVIIAKAPIPGTCKTRLIPALGPQGAAALATQMLRHAVHTALGAQLDAVEICAAPSAAHALWASLDLPLQLQWSDQGEGDLGQRMERAANRSLARGEAVLLIGSDCPGLTVQHLRDAASALERGDAAVIPAADGGYALLGLAGKQPTLFANMPWSTADVARITQARLSTAGATVHIGPTLHDIDEPADLAHLPPDFTTRFAGPATPISQEFHDT